MRKNPAGCWLHVPDLPEITCPALRLSANQERERTIVKATTPDRPRLLVYRLLMRFYNCRYELPAIAFAWPERYVWGQSKKFAGWRSLDVNSSEGPTGMAICPGRRA